MIALLSGHFYNMIRVVISFTILAGACGEVPTLLVAHRRGVSLVNGTHTQLVIPTSHGARAVDFDYETKVVYAMLGSTVRERNDFVVRLPLSDLQRDEKTNGTLNMNNLEWCGFDNLCSEHYDKDVFWEAKIITDKFSSSGSIAFDWVQKTLFWIRANKTHSIISSAATLNDNMDTLRETFVAKGLIKDLEIDPYEKTIFFLQIYSKEVTVVQSYSTSSGNTTMVHECTNNWHCFNLRVDIHKKQLILSKRYESQIALVTLDYGGIIAKNINITKHFDNSAFNFGARIVNGKLFWIKNTNRNEGCIEGQKPNALVIHDQMQGVVGWRKFDRQAQTPFPVCPPCPSGGCCRYQEQSITKTECTQCKTVDVPETCSDSSHETTVPQLNNNQSNARTNAAIITDDVSNASEKNIEVHEGSTTDSKNEHPSIDIADIDASPITGTKSAAVKAAVAVNVNSMTLLYWLVATVWISLTIVYLVVRRKMKAGSYTAARTEDDDYAF